MWPSPRHGLLTKDKFDPRWEPACILARNQWRAGAAAVAVASLTGGGLRQLLRGTRGKPLPRGSERPVQP